MIDLTQVEPGFEEPGLASQQVFRAALGAISRPGKVTEVVGPIPAGRALLLALLDQDTRLWLSKGAQREAGFLRFHTGCTLVSDAAMADFALVAGPVELPALESFSAGSDEYPDRSATVVLQVESLEAGTGWRLSGPGIKPGARLSAPGLGDGFLVQWAANRKRFPRGVDLFLACGNRLAGLPRTTRFEQ